MSVKQIKKVLILMAFSPYDAFSCFSMGLRDSLKKFGIEVSIYNGLEELSDENQVILKDRYDLIIEFNTDFAPFIDELIDEKDIPILSILMDAPYYHHKRIKEMRNRHYIACIDRTHVEYVKDYYPNIKGALFLPHAGNIPDNKKSKLTDRRYEVVFLGGIDYLDDAINFLEEQSPSIKRVLVEIIDELSQGSIPRFDKEIIRRFQLNKTEISDMLSYFSIIDYYIRMYRRGKLIDILAKSGIRVDVFGNGWNLQDYNKSNNIIIHQPVDFKTSLEIMSDSIIVINSMPLFPDGTHDRIFNACLRGAVCFTEPSQYIRERYKDGKNLMFFNIDDTDGLINSLKYVLENTEEAQKIADSGYKVTMKSEIWDERVKTIIDYFDNRL